MPPFDILHHIIAKNSTPQMVSSAGICDTAYSPGALVFQDIYENSQSKGVKFRS